MDLTRISRYLSLILRHKPWVAGVTLDRHGWADVEELLAGVSRKYPINKEILEEIVRTDNKQRYSFNDEKTKIRPIRAIPFPSTSSCPWSRRRPSSITVRAREYTASIERQGLRPKSRLYVHLSGDAVTARKVGQRHGKPVIYTVASGKMVKEGFTFYRSVNGVWLTKKVPPRFLTRYAAPDSDHEGR